MTLIDNVNKTLQEALENSLPSADRVDIAVGFFYFSGFQALAEQLRDKKIRILVGLEIDSEVIPEITQRARDEDVDLTPWQPRRPTSSLTALRQNYIDALVGFVNDSDVFDDMAASNVFDLFMAKLADGSLEIRKTIQPDHAKYYLLHNKPEFSQNGDFPGTGFMGSSNLTYRGLRGQGELNESFRDKSRFDEYAARFTESWKDSRSVAIANAATKGPFVAEVEGRIWKYLVPSPYLVYVRVLHEIFGGETEVDLLTPAAITNNRFVDLEYQIDAIRATIDRLDKYDGAILADVVGLGKSIIASAVARNLDMRTVIIAPPHLTPQWEEYKDEFGIRGYRVFSSGNISQVYERYLRVPEPLLIIIDEAHRFRNEDTTDYGMLHQICRSNPGNKMLLLTATPFNNDPKDVFSLVRLFQTPGQATIRSIDNLSLRFRGLIERYKALRHDMTTRKEGLQVDFEAREIADEQRRLIEMVVIRRSRLDLAHITRYRDDLARQHFDFAEVVGPELMEYDLGPLFDLYVRTLDRITGTSTDRAFIGARYKPVTYVADRAGLIKALGGDLDESDLKTAQTNLAQFMRRLLVMRFESSKDAFRKTLQNMIEANKLVEQWWVQLGKVPIMKKGDLPDPSTFGEEDGEISASGLEDELEALREQRGLRVVDKSLINPSFLEHVRHDQAILEEIQRDWFADPEIVDVDPKLDGLSDQIMRLLREDANRKIVIFSAYADTVRYLESELHKRGVRVTGYTALEGTATRREAVRRNFDASLPPDQQTNDHDVLVSTDALSEGYNLHRAGIVINYDIPYNPTRVIQRIGRINRINKRVFDRLYIYNCFPTAIGEAETRIRQISTLKIKLFNAVIGSDTRTLTQDEELASYFKDEYDRSERDGDQLSWDAKHREAYDRARGNAQVMEAALKLPHRSRVRRKGMGAQRAVVFGKKGGQVVFTVAADESGAEVVSVERALPFFSAEPSEEGIAIDSDFSNVFRVAKEKLFAKHELPPVKGRRAKAVKILTALGGALPEANHYCQDLVKIIRTLDDISEGTLKEIGQLNLKDLAPAFVELQRLVPAEFVRNVFDRAERERGERELLLFAEEFVS